MQTKLEAIAHELGTSPHEAKKFAGRVKDMAGEGASYARILWALRQFPTDDRPDTAAVARIIRGDSSDLHEKHVVTETQAKSPVPGASIKQPEPQAPVADRRPSRVQKFIPQSIYDASIEISYIDLYIRRSSRQLCTVTDPAVINSEMIVDLKYHGGREALPYYVKLLDDIIPHGRPIAVVPSSSADNTDSGIAQLARQLATLHRIDATHCLRRHTSKPSAAENPGADRSIDVHLRTIEVVYPNIITGRMVILLDDVTTTGNSLLACQQLLLEAGAKSVQCWALGKTRQQ